MTTTTAEPATAAKSRVPRRAVEKAALADDVAFLQALIPPPDVAENYVSRVIDDVVDMDILAYAQATGMNVLIGGDTGSGKTMFVRAYCSLHQQPFVNVDGDGTATPEDFLGGVTVDVNTGKLRWIDGPVLMVLRHGVRCVLNMDEVNFFSGKITAPLHGLFDDRGVLTLKKHPYKWYDPILDEYYIEKENSPNPGRLTVVNGAAYIRRKDGLLVVATYNPEYTDTRPLNEAFSNRFNMQLAWDYNPDVEAHLIVSVTLKKLAEKLRAARANKTIRTPISTNMLITFERHACEESLSFSLAKSMLLARFPASERTVVEAAFDQHADELRAEYGWEVVAK